MAQKFKVGDRVRCKEYIPDPTHPIYAGDLGIVDSLHGDEENLGFRLNRTNFLVINRTFRGEVVPILEMCELVEDEPAVEISSLPSSDEEAQLAALRPVRYEVFTLTQERLYMSDDWKEADTELADHLNDGWEILNISVYAVPDRRGNVTQSRYIMLRRAIDTAEWLKKEIAKIMPVVDTLSSAIASVLDMVETDGEDG